MVKKIGGLHCISITVTCTDADTLKFHISQLKPVTRDVTKAIILPPNWENQAVQQVYPEEALRTRQGKHKHVLEILIRWKI